MRWGCRSRRRCAASRDRALPDGLLQDMSKRSDGAGERRIVEIAADQCVSGQGKLRNTNPTIVVGRTLSINAHRGNACFFKKATVVGQ